MRQDFEGFRNPFSGVIENLVTELNGYWPWERGKDRYYLKILVLLVYGWCDKSWGCLYLDVGFDNRIYEKRRGGLYQLYTPQTRIKTGGAFQYKT